MLPRQASFNRDPSLGRHPAELRYDELGVGEMVARIKTDQYVEGISLIDRTPDSWVYRCRGLGQDATILRISTPTQYRDDDRTSLEGIEHRIRALDRAQGLKNFEQLVAYSMADEAAVTLPAPGTSLDKLPLPLIRAIAPDHLRQAAVTIAQGVYHGVCPDPAASNTFFDVYESFTLIDYAPTDEEDGVSAALAYAQFLLEIGGGIASFSTPLDERREWLRVVEDGLVVFRHMHGIDPISVLPQLAATRASLQRMC